MARGNPPPKGVPPPCAGRLVSGALPLPALRAVGLAGGYSRGDAARRCDGRLWLGAHPPPAARPCGMQQSGSAAHLLWARARECGDPALALRRVCLAGRRGSRGLREVVARSRGVPLSVLRGLLLSGALPLPAARPLGGQPGPAARVFWARVLRAGGALTGQTVCALASQRCALRGWQGNLRGGAASSRSEGHLWLGAQPPFAARPWGKQSGPAVHLLSARQCSCGDPALALWRAGPLGCRAPQTWWEDVPGGPSLRCLVSGALPLPAPRLSGGQPGPAARFCWAWVVRAWGPSTGSTACALVSRRCALWEWQEGVAGKDASCRSEGRVSSGAHPPPAARPWARQSGPVLHVLWARVSDVGTRHCPFSVRALRGVARPWVAGSFSRGGTSHRCEGGLVSGALPPPAACALGG